MRGQRLRPLAKGYPRGGGIVDRDVKREDQSRNTAGPAALVRAMTIVCELEEASTEAPSIEVDPTSVEAVRARVSENEARELRDLRAHIESRLSMMRSRSIEIDVTDVDITEQIIEAVRADLHARGWETRRQGADRRILEIILPDVDAGPSEQECGAEGQARERADVLDFMRHPPGRVTDSQRQFLDELIKAIERGAHVGSASRLYPDRVSAGDPDERLHAAPKGRVSDGEIQRLIRRSIHRGCSIDVHVDGAPVVFWSVDVESQAEALVAAILSVGVGS